MRHVATAICLSILSILISGCSPVFRFELLPRSEGAEIIEWRQQISKMVTDHDERIEALEKKGDRNGNED